VFDRITNSPTNPLRSGKPTMVSEAITKYVAVRGSLAANPP
jgi:hypothetical protein